MIRKSKKQINREVDAEFETKTKEEALAEFAQSPVLYVPAKKRESILISIRLPKAMIDELRDIAIKKGDIGYQQIIKIYVADGIRRENQNLDGSSIHGKENKAA